MLPTLSLIMLKEDLGIKNPNHRMAIKREIDFCFPRTNENHSRVQMGVGLGEERRGSLFSMDEFVAPGSPMRTSSSSIYEMADSVLSTSASLSADGKINGIDSKSRSRCLVLTLRPEQKVPVEQKELLKSKFALLNYNVEIITSDEKPGSYILVFDDVEKALEANAQSNKLGYQLTKYRERRPSPDNPVMFKTLTPVKVRVGKSLKSKIVMMLEKDDIILVNQVKRRRARAISSPGGEQVGWVSLHCDKGKPFLRRLERA